MIQIPRHYLKLGHDSFLPNVSTVHDPNSKTLSQIRPRQLPSKSFLLLMFQVPGHYLKLNHDSFLPNRVQCVIRIHQHLTARRCVEYPDIRSIISQHKATKNPEETPICHSTFTMKDILIYTSSCHAPEILDVGSISGYTFLRNTGRALCDVLVQFLY